MSAEEKQLGVFQSSVSGSSDDQPSEEQEVFGNDEKHEVCRVSSLQVLKSGIKGETRSNTVLSPGRWWLPS